MSDFSYETLLIEELISSKDSNLSEILSASNNCRKLRKTYLLFRLPEMH
jgi:hypothetical protein